MALSDGDARSGVTIARRISVSHFWLALACVLFSAPIAANETAEPSATELIEGLLSGRAPVGGPFELTDQTGHRRTDADFQGKLVVDAWAGVADTSAGIGSPLFVRNVSAKFCPG